MEKRSINQKTENNQSNSKETKTPATKKVTATSKDVQSSTTPSTKNPTVSNTPKVTASKKSTTNSLANTKKPTINELYAKKTADSSKSAAVKPVSGKTQPITTTNTKTTPKTSANKAVTTPTSKGSTLNDKFAQAKKSTSSTTTPSNAKPTTQSSSNKQPAALKAVANDKAKTGTDTKKSTSANSLNDKFAKATKEKATTVNDKFAQNKKSDKELVEKAMKIAGVTPRKNPTPPTTENKENKQRNFPTVQVNKGPNPKKDEQSSTIGLGPLKPATTTTPEKTKSHGLEIPVLTTFSNPAETAEKVKADIANGRPRQKNAHLVAPALKAAKFHQKLQTEMGISHNKAVETPPINKPTTESKETIHQLDSSNSKPDFSSFLEKPTMTYQTSTKGGFPDDDMENNYWKAPISQQEQAPKRQRFSLKEFFLFSSGVDRDVLQHCPSDESRFIGVGGTVIFTGILAFLSSSYAIFTVFDNWPMAIFFGMVWGFMIYNLDRYIVASMKNHGNWWKDMGVAFPRLIMAVLLALVISKPLELKIFEKEINTKLVSMEQEIFSEQEAQVKARFTSQIENYETAAEEMEDRLVVLREKRDQLEMMALREADGSGGSGNKNMGPIYRAKRADADQAEQEFQEEKARLTPKIEFNKEKMNELKSEMEEEMANLDKESFGGLAARMDALHRLGTESEAIWWASFMIMLLFVIVEISPVLVKLISSKTSYDYLSMHKEHAIKMATQEEIAEANKYLENRLKFESETNDYRTQAMIQLEKEMIDSFIQRKRDALKNQPTKGKKPTLNTEVRNINTEAKVLAS